jgi:hypothetical protein
VEAISYPFSRNLLQVNRICGKFKTSLIGIFINHSIPFHCFVLFFVFCFPLGKDVVLKIDILLVLRNNYSL